jgi:hypothetical protein
MESHPTILFILIMMLLVSLSAQQFEMRDTSGMRWFKGNIHTHAREGESDSPVDSVVQWYRDHGYDFLVITDHSTITLPSGLKEPADSSFLLIPGEEITGHGHQGELEINALNIYEAIPPVHDSTDLGALQKCIHAVRQGKGVPVINHPNYQWRLGRNILFNSRDCHLFELYNGFPGTNCEGGAGHPGLEAVWDFLLTSGKRIYGVAVDDAHVYQELSPEHSNPGRGWVVVRSKDLDAEEITRHFDSGLFYSSTGLELLDLRIDFSRIIIIIKDTGNTEYTTDFIGSGGKLLYRTNINPAVYRLSTENHYVRAKITDTTGHCAWIQPVFVAR